MRIGSGVYKRKDGRYEARYRKGINSEGKTVLASVYGRTRAEAEAKRAAITKKPTLGERLAGINHKQLNLLILGAGTHGHDVMKIARKLGVFQKISFLDDGITGDEIIGKCHEAVDFIKEYPCAFIAIGDYKTRKKYAEFLWEKNFILPKIISPEAIVSPEAKIGEGCVVLDGAVVEAAELPGSTVWYFKIQILFYIILTVSMRISKEKACLLVCAFSLCYGLIADFIIELPDYWWKTSLCFMAGCNPYGDGHACERIADILEGKEYQPWMPA